MAVSCRLCQPLTAATSSTSNKVPWAPSVSSKINLFARAWKKSQLTGRTGEQDGGGGRGSTRTGKGSAAEKSGPGYQVQRGGTEEKGRGMKVRKGKKESFLTTMEVHAGRNTIAALPGPSPPAGFILDEEGAVVFVAPTANRVVTIVDASSQRPLQCMIRRAFRSSDGRDCLLLLPLDMPLQILKIDEEREGLTELSDEELQETLPSAVYALAKRRLHLIVSGFCLTARGGFCYTEEHVLDFKTEYAEGLGGSLTEGVEIANFQLGNSEYIIYTPFDPVMFVVHRDETTGQLKIADDELLDDEVVLDAIDEENEFQLLVVLEAPQRKPIVRGDTSDSRNDSFVTSIVVQDEEDAMHETLREAK